MKNIILLLLSCLLVVSPLCAAEDAVDAASKKKAEVWCKKVLDCEKNAVAALKKVKEVKHFKRGEKALARIKKSLPDDVKRGGSSRRPIEKSLTSAQKLAVRKYAEQFEKLEEELEEEMERLDGVMSRVSVIDEKSEESYSSIIDEASKLSSIASDLACIREDSDADDEYDEDDEDASFGPRPSRRDADLDVDSSASDKAVRKQKETIITRKYKKIGMDFFCDAEDEFAPDNVKGMLIDLGMNFPAGSSAKYNESSGTLTVANVASEHEYLEELCQEYAKRRKRK